MKRPVPWLLWCVICCAGVGCDGDGALEIIEHQPADGGLADADLRPVVVADVPPPPIAGGGLLATHDRAVVADRDRDRILVVDLQRGLTLAEHAAEGPGRIAADVDRAYVAIDGAVAVLALDDGRLRARWPVCPTPRALAVDGPWLHVACLGGALQRIELDSGRIVATRHLDADPRDLLVVDGRLWISLFRTAGIRVVDGPDVHPIPAPRRTEAGVEWQGRVGWRLRRLPDGRVALLHQWHRRDPAPAAYGRDRTDCNTGRVVPGLTVYPPDAHRPGSQPPVHRAIGGATLVVDFAVDGDWLGLATPGERDARDPYAAPPLDDARVPLRRLPLERIGRAGDGARTCLPVRAGGRGRLRPIAVAGGAGGLLYLDRNDGLAWFDGDAPLPWLGGAPVSDTGHDLFHIDAGGGVTCANCHPEGGDDGHTWHVADGLRRRTPSLFGGLAGTAPHHWDGAFVDLDHLLVGVRGRLMGGGPLTPAQRAAMVRWIEELPAPVFDAGSDPAAIARGAALFERLDCGDCHPAPAYADGRSHLVGGVEIQTARLIGLGLRGGLTHRGCALDLAARFEPTDDCGDALHPPLAPAHVDDLLAFLSSL